MILKCVNKVIIHIYLYLFSISLNRVILRRGSIPNTLKSKNNNYIVDKEFYKKYVCVRCACSPHPGAPLTRDAGPVTQTPLLLTRLNRSSLSTGGQRWRENISPTRWSVNYAEMLTRYLVKTHTTEKLTPLHTIYNFLLIIII